MNNLILRLINSLLETCLKEMEDSHFDQAIADVKIIDSKILTATSFQLGIIYEALHAAKPYCKNGGSLDRILANIKSRIWENFRASRFNYFDTVRLPDDLDTASVIVRVLDDERVWEAFSEFVSMNKAPEGFISTWSNLSKNDGIKRASGDNPFHVDVMLNYFLTVIQSNAGKYFDIERLRNLIRRHRLINYWYIPFFYSSYLYSKLLLSKKELFLKEDLEHLDENIIRCTPDSIENSNCGLLNTCKLGQVREIVAKEHQSSWLNRAYYMGALCNRAVFLHNRVQALDRIIMNELEIIEKERNCSIPALFWTLGFKPYRSGALNDTIYLEILTRVAEYLSLKSEG